MAKAIVDRQNEFYRRCGAARTAKQQPRFEFPDGTTEVAPSRSVVELVKHCRIDVKLDGEKDYFGRRVTQPTFCLDRAVGLTDKQAYTRAGMFTLTTKMVAASWSLPSGPVRLGGSCVHSDATSAAQRLMTSENLFVCHGCYAINGQYSFLNQQLVRAIRLEWLQRLLHKHSATAVAEILAEALNAFWAKPRKGKSAKGQPKIEANTNYFRLHDSGDFLWGNRKYLEVWCHVAAAFPHVLFWAPTRDYPSKTFQNAAARRPENFIIRPSAFHVEDPAPRVSGLDAGSTVSFDIDADRRGLVDWVCPVYKNDEENCETATGPEGTGCRVCWEAPDMTVCYGAHGSGMPKAILKGTGFTVRPKPKKNPPSLHDIFDAFEGRTRRNPSSETVETFMLKHGVDPSQYSEDEWVETLIERGIVEDADEAAEYIEQNSEWQAFQG